MAVRGSFVKRVFVLAAMSVAPGCGDAVTAPSTQMDEALRLSVTSATLEPGESLRIEATASVPVLWESSDPQVVAVSPTGVVEARKEGDAEITARAKGKRGKAKVKVTQPASDPAPAPAEPTPTPTPTPEPEPEPTPTPTPAPTTGTPVFQDGFEAGTVAAGQGGYGWTGFSMASGEGVSVSRQIARSGSYSMKFLFAGNKKCDDSWAEQRFTLGENLTEVWLEWYLYLPNGNEGVGPRFYHRQPTKSAGGGTCSAEADLATNNKFLRLWDLNYNDFDVKAGFELRRLGSGVDGDSYLYGMYGSDTRAIGDWGTPQWSPAVTDATRGRWIQIRVRAKLADSKEAANGVLQLWADGVQRINLTGLDMAASAGGNNFFRNGYLMGWANSGFDQNTAVFVDDFKIFRSSPGW